MSNIFIIARGAYDAFYKWKDNKSSDNNDNKSGNNNSNTDKTPNKAQDIKKNLNDSKTQWKIIIDLRFLLFLCLINILKPLKVILIRILWNVLNGGRWELI